MKNFSLTVILALLMMLFGCDGNDHQSGPGTTAVFGKVIDGYWSGAVVCLDSTDNESCEDEPDQYVSRTDATGAYELNNISDELLGTKYILAEADGQTMDTSRGTTVAAGSKMIAPAMMALNNGSRKLHLTPLLSVITKDAKMTGSYFGPGYRETLAVLLGVNPSINISVIDYMACGNESLSCEAFKHLNEILFEDDNYADLFSGGTVTDGFVKNVLAKTEAALGGPFGDYVSLADLIEFSGEEAEHEALFGYAAPRSAPDTSMDGKEYQERIDAADMTNSVREIAIEGVSAIPYVGWAAGMFLELAWPESEADLTDLLYRDLKKMIREEIINHVANHYNRDLLALKNAMDKYRDTGDVTIFNDHVFKASYTLINRLQSDQAYIVRMLPQYVFAFNARMVAHVERLKLYQGGEAVADSQEQIYTDMAHDYTNFRDRLLAGENGFYQQYLKYRTGNIHMESRKSEGFMQWTRCHGDYEDKIADFQIHYETFRDYCNDGDPNFYRESVDNVHLRRLNEIKLEAAKLFSSIFLLSRMVPEGVLAQYAPAGKTVYPTEKLGRESYYVPDDFKQIEVGPISRSCLHFGERDDYRAEFTKLKIECKNPPKQSAAFTTPVTVVAGQMHKPPRQYNRNHYINLMGFQETSGSEQEIGFRVTGPEERQQRIDPPEKSYQLTGFDAMRFGYDTLGHSETITMGYELGLFQLTPHFAALKEDRKLYQWKNTLNPGEFSKWHAFEAMPVNYAIKGSNDYKVSAVSQAMNPFQTQIGNVYYLWVTFRYSLDGKTFLQD